MHEDLRTLLSQRDGALPVVFLTGAGTSAESGIPTFRGQGGYWTAGSQVYQPQQIATWAFFLEDPWEVWRWYLYRRGVCAAAAPNAAHYALAELERAIPDTFHLITQNIDGLHHLAGNTEARMYEVHGNGDLMRCADRCSTDRWPIPAGVASKTAEDAITDAEKALLCCPRCGEMARPHVLWFDEHYEEPLYRSDSAMDAASRAGVLITVGTTGATSLPIHAVAAASQAGALILDVNPEDNVFQRHADSRRRGAALRGTATEWVPILAEILAG